MGAHVPTVVVVVEVVVDVVVVDVVVVVVVDVVVVAIVVVVVATVVMVVAIVVVVVATVVVVVATVVVVDATVVVVDATVVVVDATVVVVDATVVVVDATVVVVDATVVVVVATVVVVVATVVLVVATVVLVVATVVVVVPPPPAQPPDTHASQQLDCVPTQALPPEGAVHALALPLTLHVVAPVASVWQQVTAPARPHVELPAQLMTTSAHCLDSVPAWTAWFVTFAAHLWYAPWLLKPEQGHCWAICARVAATACASPGLSPQAAKLASAAARRRARAERRRTNDLMMRLLPAGRSGTSAAAQAPSTPEVRSAIPSSGKICFSLEGKSPTEFDEGSRYIRVRNVHC